MLSAENFRLWLSSAQPGDELAYYHGDLSSDSDPDRHGRRAIPLNQLIDAVVDAQSRRKVRLREAKLPGGVTEYLAVRQ
jgi:hypothetical protein